VYDRARRHEHLLADLDQTGRSKELSAPSGHEIEMVTAAFLLPS
jgi:hypothetical protein